MVTTIFDVFFLIAVVIMWFMIGYQFILTVAGQVLFRKSHRELLDIQQHPPDYPRVTILVPAHNEAMVIERTVRSLLALEYPEQMLDILLIDDASTDATPALLDELAAKYQRVRVLHRIPPEGGRGKSAALNAAYKLTDSEYIAVYDADNQPEACALKLLIAHLVRHQNLGAALGMFRTGNKNRNLLTRCINIEGLSFQWILQAGRWQLLKVATLPGTNFVIRRSLLELLDGWDEEALTEDSELSIRIYQAGYQIAFVPYSITWEQEPETIRVWLKQRTRWVRGNNYVISKLLRSIMASRNRVLAFEMLYSLALYYIFLLAIITSDIIFLLGLCGIKLVSIFGPFTQVWLAALVLYALEIFLALSYNDEDTPSNSLLSIVMYFTYSQAWLVVVFRAFWADYIKREKRVWDKTVRFDTAIEPRKPIEK